MKRPVPKKGRADECAKKQRVGAPKFGLDPNKADTIGIAHGDPDALEKLLATFAVEDRDAASFLNRHLVELSRERIEAGDLEIPNGALALLNELKPRDAAETMLCTQMIGAQILAMQCMRTAAFPATTAKSREASLRHAERMMRIFTQQLDALNKHRGKGQQKVTVEHVTVNEGGQAVVGNIDRD